MLNGWWFLSSGGSYPLVFTVVHNYGRMSLQDEQTKALTYIGLQG